MTPYNIKTVVELILKFDGLIVVGTLITKVLNSKR